MHDEAVETGNDARAVSASSPVPVASGRLAILSLLSVAARAMPIPFIPDRAVAQIRGAIVQDIASRHGLSLTTDARAAFSDESSDSPARQIARKAITVLSRTVAKRLSPLATLSTIGSGVEVFALGQLFARYIERHRSASAVRIHAEEAREIRRMIDKAIVRALSPTLKPEVVPLLPAVEDLRDDFTRTLDTVLIVGSGLPSYLERRLNAAFDDIVREGA
jgi:hypothetical protein